ncbi:MAG: hypothetical protein ABJH08_08750 [Balneola sp.]
MKQYILLSACILAFFNCDVVNNGAIELKGDVIYQNSFEKESDLSDWDGFHRVELRDDSPRTGGKKSVFISGGCVFPHAQYTFYAEKTGLIQLSVLAKDLSIGGSISLTKDEYKNGLHIIVKNKNWEELTSEEPLFVTKGEKITLNMSSGGFVSSSMLVSKVELSFVSTQ